MKSDLREKWLPTIERAIQATNTREYWSPFAEIPSEKLYGEGAKARGLEQFQALRDRQFELYDSDRNYATLTAPTSPYGEQLGISYQEVPPEELLSRADAAYDSLNQISLMDRAAIALEILHRINQQSFLMAHATMHTTGQPYIMAFQAGGPHAQDRGLEAVALAVKLLRDIPSEAVWEKPLGKSAKIANEKRWRVVGQGIGLVVGCSTFPNWNSYAAIFANLVCGNPTIVKPHPRAILPLALTVRTAREVLREVGCNEDICLLGVDTPQNPIARELATKAEVRTVDFTGGSEFGSWLEKNATQARVYTEKSAANPIVIGDFANIGGMSANIALSLTLFSGQMCTTPRSIFIASNSKSGFEAITDEIRKALRNLLADETRACEILGAICVPETAERIDAIEQGNEVILESRKIKHPNYPSATVLTPALIKLDKGSALLGQEQFGPIAFIVPVADFNEGLERARTVVESGGALNIKVYSDQEEELTAARAMCLRAKVGLAENFVRHALVNHSAAYSDFHGTGANNAANTSLGDAMFITGRYFVSQQRREIE